GVIRGVAEGVESFFYEPYKACFDISFLFGSSVDVFFFFFQGAMEGPIEFIEGMVSGTRHLVGSAVGGAAGAISTITVVASKGLGKCFLGLVARPASGIADFTSTSFDVIKR